METEQVLYFILASLGLLVLISLLTGQNLFAAVVTNMTQQRTSIDVLKASGTNEPEQNGEFYNYLVKINADLDVSPEPKQDIPVVSVFYFKDKYERGSEFTISAGEKRLSVPLEANILSRSPPLSEETVGDEKTFNEGQDYLFYVGRGVFKIGMHDIHLEGLPWGMECVTKFRVECRDMLQYTGKLKSCENDIDKDCITTVQLCDGSVTIKATELDCKESTATVDVDAEGDVEWDAPEYAVISFFERSGCTDTIRDLSLLKGACSNDFLGSERVTV